MLEMAAFADFGTPDVERALRGKHPLDEHGGVFTQPIIKQIAEDTLARGNLDKGTHATTVAGVFLQVGINLLLVQQVKHDVRQHAQGGNREDGGLCVWIHILNCFGANT